MEYMQLNLDSNLFDMGSILGSNGSAELISQINQSTGFGGSYFGSTNDPFKNHFNHFLQSVVVPLRQLNYTLQASNAAVHIQDRIIPITSVKQLEKGIPPCMELPILLYEPIRELAEAGRIDGFGIDPTLLPPEDCYHRLIHNGEIVITPSTIRPDGEYTAVDLTYSDDPLLSEDELDAICVTRAFLDTYLTDPETCHLDPTAPGNMRA